MMPKLPRGPKQPRVQNPIGWRRPGTPKLPPVPKTELPEDEEANRSARWEAFRAHSAASYPEFIVYEYLTKRKKWKDGVEFQFQYPFLGGRTIFGGFVVDFAFPQFRMVWNIQGLRFHLAKTVDRARDILVKSILSNRGYLVVYLWEDDLLQRSDYTIERALVGQEVGGRKLD